MSIRYLLFLSSNSIPHLFCESRTGSLHTTFPPNPLQTIFLLALANGRQWQEVERRWREEMAPPASTSDYRSRQLWFHLPASFCTPGSGHSQWCHPAAILLCLSGWSTDTRCPAINLNIGSMATSPTPQSRPCWGSSSSC